MQIHVVNSLFRLLKVRFVTIFVVRFMAMFNSGLGRILEACQVHEKVGLQHSSKSTKYELEGSCNDPVHEHLSFLKSDKQPRECNEVSESSTYGKSTL